VFVQQPFGSGDSKHPEYAYKLKKSLYGSKQAWYDRLSNFLLENNFKRR